MMFKNILFRILFMSLLAIIYLNTAASAEQVMRLAEKSDQQIIILEINCVDTSNSKDCNIATTKIYRTL